MRCSAWSSLAISVCRAEARLALLLALALTFAGAARAHVDAYPAFLETKGTEAISLTAHNDRKLPMEAFAATASPGLRVVEAGRLDGWTSSVDGNTATWTGGSLAADDAATFSVVLRGPAEPEAVFLHVEQQYPDDRIVSRPVSLTVVPAGETGTAAWVYPAVGAGLVLAAAGVALTWRRRRA